MLRLLDIPVRRLFIVVLVLKIGSSGLGWLLRMPWSFGLAIPLALMSTYIALGLLRRDDDVSDEKFADTCYYLGFIFTITSIVFSLFDLPEIGTQIENVAVRFGAAMISTVLGLVVRVYLVSFRRDVTDAVEEAERGVIDASNRFREQLVIAFERLRDFESDVDLAARASAERVNLQVEALAKSHAARLDAFFADLEARNRQSVTDSLAEVKGAGARLATFIEEYASAMRSHLTAMHHFVNATTDRVLERLRTAEFPEDYFERHLTGPMRQLRSSSEEVSSSVRVAAGAVSRSSLLLLNSMRKLRERSSTTVDSLDAVRELAGQQRAMMETAAGQLALLEQLTGTLARLDAQLELSAASADAGATATQALAARVDENLAATAAIARRLDDVAARVAAATPDPAT